MFSTEHDKQNAGNYERVVFGRDTRACYHLRAGEITATTRTKRRPFKTTVATDGGQLAVFLSPRTVPYSRPRGRFREEPRRSRFHTCRGLRLNRADQITLSAETKDASTVQH
ncbi:hypothetical protein SKAU_G00414130 [Synaphobranchus kaupii]|uniref:Uncharacterized protein n=1 Tax=Synaphobranchus kaupii TaxID=118154 RepID=A0A9Q1IAI5_SYNKA|nr:hypothetical protein SKAU_G00414130 [Synaphobranchus kaupii]